MKNSHLLLLVLGVAALAVMAVFNPKKPHGPSPGPSPAPAPKRTFTIENDRFIKDGTPLRLISGSIHYNRIPPTYWRDRLLRVRALGLNSIEFYVPWNFHEPQPGEFLWSGSRNITRFLDLAQELGLNVVLRPGPYICAEWDNGGFPWWLASSKVAGGRKMGLRVADPDYLDHVDRWWGELLPRLAPYLHTRGGPIILTQIENEYGFCNFNDKVYLRHLAASARKAFGADAVLFTTDPPQVTAIGSLYGDEVLTVVDFGPGVDPAWAFAAQSTMNEVGKSPPFCSEFYTGWLSHWGEPMANTTVSLVTNSLRAILEYGNGTGSVNMYMAHGGTSFGYWAGANKAIDIYQPDITSYDYDCPVGEAGGYGQPGIGGPNKFELIRGVIADVTGETPPDAPPPPELRGYGAVELDEGALLLEELGALVPGDGIFVEHPDIMEEGGLILYRTTVPATALNGGAVLDISEPVRDYAKVLVDGRVVGRLERSNPRNLTLPTAPAGNEGAVLDILVEALGRVNFGCEWDFKGLTSPDVRLNGALLICCIAALLVCYSVPSSQAKQTPLPIPIFTIMPKGLWHFSTESPQI